MRPPLADPALRRAAILGGGARGQQWAGRFLAAGWEVALFDPDPAARAAVPPGPARTRLRIAPLISDAVAGALWIADCAPDRLALKRKLYQKVQAHCRADAVIVVTGTAFSVSDLQSCATRPAQILVIDAAPVPDGPTPATVLPGKFSTSVYLETARAILPAIGPSARVSRTEIMSKPPPV